MNAGSPRPPQSSEGTTPDQQAIAANPDLCAWVAANAGSGKTKVLIDRVARLLLRGAEPASILCVTYTKAAASEMQARLFERLGAWCVMQTEALCTELGRLEGRAARSYEPDEIGRARELFARALETPGGLRIETIHAFCGRVLRRFPLEAGAPPGFAELEDWETTALWEQAIRTVGREAGLRPDLARATHAATLAGGKVLDALNAVKPHRMDIEDYLHRQGGVEAAIDALLLMTAAPAAAEEEILSRAMGPDLPRGRLEEARTALAAGGTKDQKMAEKIAEALGESSAEIRFSAYRSIFFTDNGVLRSSARLINKATLSAHPYLGDLFATGAPMGRETTRILEVDTALKARRIFDRSAALLRLCAVQFEAFAKAKRDRGTLDFDDLIDVASRLLNRSGASDWVLWKLDGGISHILVDEAQDTNPRQWAILNRLGEDIFAGRSGDRPQARTLFVVGDQKQSIYSFQGADPEHFLKETQDFSARAHRGGVRHAQPHLATSFRSTPEVLAFVDEVFNPERFDGGAPFSLRPPVDADQPRHEANRAKEPGLVELWPLEPQPARSDPDPWDAPRGQESEGSPKLVLAQRIARRIRDEIAAGAAVWRNGDRAAARAGDYLILVRSRKGGLFDALLQALKREGLPVAGADRIELLDNLPVQDLLNLIRFVLCPEDDLTLAEILKGPFGDLDDGDLMALAPHRTGSLWTVLQAATDPRHRKAGDRLATLPGLSTLPPFEFLSAVLEQSLEHAGSDTPMRGSGWSRILSRFGPPAREPITALLDRAAAFDANGPSSLQLFLDAIESRGGEVKRELSGPGDAVRVMTVHGAKGLEAPVVILPDTVNAPKSDKDGLFLGEGGAPLWVGKKDNDIPLTQKLREETLQRGIREHRRLLYVALTRARDRLIVCGAAQRRKEKNGAGDNGGEDGTETMVERGRAEGSWHDLCEAAMRSLAAAGLAAEERDADGRVTYRLGQQSFGAQADAAGARGPQRPDWLDRPPPAEPAPPRMLSPSGLDGGEGPALAPFGPGRAERLRRGRIIHLLFEVLGEMEPARRAAAADRLLAREPGLTDADRQEMKTAALGVLNDPAFARLFGPGGRAEAPVVGRLGGDVINGRVDRLVVAPDEVLVIDYKTDRPAPTDVSRVEPTYVLQMAAYRAILADAWPGRAVRCLLVWTDGPRLMEIPAQAMDAALERLSS